MTTPCEETAMMVTFFTFLFMIMPQCYSRTTTRQGYDYGCGYSPEFGEGVCRCFFVDGSMYADCTENPNLQSVPEFTSRELDIMHGITMAGTLVCGHDDAMLHVPKSVKVVCTTNNGDVRESHAANRVEPERTKVGYSRGLVAGVSVACIAAVVTTIVSIVVCKVCKNQFISPTPLCLRMKFYFK